MGALPEVEGRMTTCSGCPRCGSRDVAPMRPEDPGALQQGYEESFVADFECKKCQTRFRYTPPARPAPKETTP